MELPHDVCGNGPPIVLLHAGVADRSMWSEHLPVLAGAGYRAIAIDLPGFGEADTLEQLDVPWNAVLETMDGLGVDRAHLLGSSFGGLVAQCVAVLAPARTRSLVLVSSPVEGVEPSERLQAAFDAEERALEDEDLDGAVSAMVEAWTLPDAPEELRRRVAAMQRRAFEIQIAVEPPAEPAADPLGGGTDRLRDVHVPALVIVGEHDMQDFHLAADALIDALPDARLSCIDGAGHLAPLERPMEFDEQLLAFLAALEGSDMPSL